VGRKRQRWRANWKKARRFCWRICGSTQKKANDEKFAKQLPASRTFMLMMRLARHTVHASTGNHQVVKKSAAGCSCKRNSTTWARRCKPGEAVCCTLGGAKVRTKSRHPEPDDQSRCAHHWGGMAYTFLKRRVKSRKVLVENDKLDLARQLLKEAKSQVKILFRGPCWFDKLDALRKPRQSGSDARFLGHDGAGHRTKKR